MKTYWQQGHDDEDLPATSEQISEALDMQREREDQYPEVLFVEHTYQELAQLTRAEVSRIMDTLADGVC